MGIRKITHQLIPTAPISMMERERGGGKRRESFTHRHRERRATTRAEGFKASDDGNWNQRAISACTRRANVGMCKRHRASQARWKRSLAAFLLRLAARESCICRDKPQVWFSIPNTMNLHSTGKAEVEPWYQSRPSLKMVHMN